MEKITFDSSKASSFLSEYEINYFEGYVNKHMKCYINKTGPGNEFLGWVDLPLNYDKEEFARIKKVCREN